MHISIENRTYPHEYILFFIVISIEINSLMFVVRKSLEYYTHIIVYRKVLLFVVSGKKKRYKLEYSKKRNQIFKVWLKLKPH